MPVGYALSLCGACSASAAMPWCVACSAQHWSRQRHASRVRQGLARARARGRRGGRPRAISAVRLQAIRQALADGMTKARACRVFGVKRTTLYDALAREASGAGCG